MAHNPLNEIMTPKSVAIVGASNNPSKMGTMQFLNILHSDYPGEIIPVHPKEKEVFGKKAYPSIKELPYAPELALMVVPTRLVAEMLNDFGEKGTKRAIIITAGFKEAGEDGVLLEKEINAIAAKFNIRFLGPNCMGVINTAMPFNATVTPYALPPGNFSLASQSGTYLAQVIGYFDERGIRIRQSISVGNEASIDMVDCLEYLGSDPGTMAIGLYIESLKRAKHFLEIAREITKEKPIVAQYVGGTKAGASSGASHTGSLAGPDDLYNGLFAQAGIIRVESIEEVFRGGHALAIQPPLKGGNIAVLTHSGGPGSGMCDTGDRMGLSIDPLPEEDQAKIRGIIPAHASSKNPVDLTFSMDMGLMTDKLPRILFESNAVDGILLHGVMDTGWADVAFPLWNKALGVSKEEIIKYMTIDVDPLIAMPKKYDKPVVCSTFMGPADHARQEMQKGGIPVFDSPERAAKAMGYLYKHYLVRTRKTGKPPVSPRPGKTAEIMDKQGTKAMDEFTAKKVLSGYGIPVCHEAFVQDVNEAVAAAEAIGYPVALKACSAEIMHKSEGGLVHLNLQNEEELKKAAESMGGLPMLVCEMVKSRREFMAGMKRFPGFGPCIVFGIGGIFAEAMKDHVWRLAPLSKEDALEMIESITTKKLLGPFRGMKEVNREELGGILVSLAHIAMDFEQISEIDINPICIENGRPKAVDALFVLEK